MKNISKLLLFISLVSYTFMKDCSTADPCGGEIESGKEGNYACFAKDESSECTWTLYCSKVPKPSPSTGEDGRRNLETIICSDYPVENADNACVTNTVTEGETANDACMEISLCSKAKNVADPANDCQNYAKTFPNAQCVQDEEVTGTCKQQFPCLSVTKADLKKDTSIDCSKGIPTNSETHYCTSSGVTLADEEVDTTLICKEEPYCESASTDSTAKCSTFEVIDKNKGCIEDSTKAKKCVEKDLCESVTELDGTKCSDYPVVKDNSATYVCIDNIDSSTGTNKVGQPCKEEQLCTEVTADGDNCLSYPVPLDDREEQGCGKPTAEGNCIQVFLCNKATKSGTLACSDFPLTWENINTHKCINGETDTSCKEVPYCNFATPDSEKGCDGFPTQGIDTTCNKKSESECKEEPKTQNPDTDTECTTSTSADSDAACKALTITGNDGTLECVENKDKKGGDKPCITKVIDCKNKIKDATQSICEKLTVENKEQQICRLDSTQTKCEQVTYCELGTGENDNDCSKYALKDKNKVCKKSSSENTCEEVSSSTSEEDNTMCQEALTGEDDTECSKYKVTNKDLNECVHNENSAIGNTPCMEKLINCED